jgi:hypothetical protein
MTLNVTRLGVRARSRALLKRLSEEIPKEVFEENPSTKRGRN